MKTLIPAAAALALWTVIATRPPAAAAQLEAEARPENSAFKKSGP